MITEKSYKFVERNKRKIIRSFYCDKATWDIIKNFKDEDESISHFLRRLVWEHLGRLETNMGVN